MSQSRAVTCASCGEDLPAVESTLAFGDRQSCPNCGSRDRSMAVEASSSAAIRDGVRVQQKRPGVRNYLLDATLDMPDVQGDTGRPSRLTRIIDKNTYSYEERVTDEETGELLRYSAHPLRQHRGHGSDPGPRTSPPPQVSKRKLTADDQQEDHGA